jgi:hypothetical protein
MKVGDKVRCFIGIKNLCEVDKTYTVYDVWNSGEYIKIDASSSYFIKADGNFVLLPPIRNMSKKIRVI